MTETISWMASISLQLLPGGLWCAWWLFAVDWKSVWPMLARGGWVAVLLLGLMATLLWASLFPAPLRFAGLRINNFWWQLGGVTGLIVAALLCGWLQGVINWTPPTVSFTPDTDAASDHYA